VTGNEFLWQRAGFRAFGLPDVRRGRARVASTNVSGTISSNTTWTVSGSPYVATGNVTVAAGVTLTIQAGVTLAFSPQHNYGLTVNGTLSAVGTAANPIVITSNAASPAKGDWYQISFGAGSVGTLTYVAVYYGANGSADDAYAAVSIPSSTATVTIDHSDFEHNQRSGIKVFNGAAVTVTNSTFTDNAIGMTISGQATLDADTISNNTNRGLSFSLINPCNGKPTLVTNSKIESNTNDGVFINANNSCTPLNGMPTGFRNDIDGNGGKQLKTLGSPSFKNAQVSWRQIYWGSDAYYFVNPGACVNSSPYASGHVGYRSSGSNPPDGPIGGGSYLAGTSTVCGYDNFDTKDAEPAPVASGSPLVPVGMTLGGCTVNLLRVAEPGIGGQTIDAKDPTTCIEDPVNTATGNFMQAADDLALPGTGISFGFRRSYNSLDASSGILGRGWTHSYNASLAVQTNGDVLLRAETGQQRMSGSSWNLGGDPRLAVRQ
jgi:hypothetical protein